MNIAFKIIEYAQPNTKFILSLVFFSNLFLGLSLLFLNILKFTCLPLTCTSRAYASFESKISADEDSMVV